MPLTDSVQDMLSVFDRLSPDEKLVFAKEIGKRVKQNIENAEGGPLDDDELMFISDQIFRMFDREEEWSQAAS